MTELVSDERTSGPAPGTLGAAPAPRDEPWTAQDIEQYVGKPIFVKGNEPEPLIRWLLRIVNGKTLVFCKAEELAAAEKEGREPQSVGFPLNTFIGPVISEDPLTFSQIRVGQRLWEIRELAAKVTTLEESLKRATEMLRPLNGLLAEHSDCYREGNCPECRDLRTSVAAFLEKGQ